MAPNLAFAASAYGKEWTKPSLITNGYSNYGLQMAVYRGELYGIMTQNAGYNNQLFATKYKPSTGWKLFYSLPEKFKAAGRTAVAVLDDRFFVAYRGTNDHVYLVWTQDFVHWNDAGRIGSQYAKSAVAPGLAAYDGKLYLTGVGADKYIYFTVLNENGQREQSWKKIENTGTRSALNLNVFDGSLYLFHTGYNNGKIFYQKLGSDGWSKLDSVEAKDISSGVSSTPWKYNALILTYRGKNREVVYRSVGAGKFSPEATIPGAKMLSQTGLSTWGGALVVSFGAASGSSSALSGYQIPMSMNEKSSFVSEEEVNEWDCKWQEPKEEKSLIRKFFCW